MLRASFEAPLPRVDGALWRLGILLPWVLLLVLTYADAQAPLRLRGVIERFDGRVVTLRERNGETLDVALADNLTFQEVLPIDIGAIQPGAFVGTAALPRPDGSLQALEVVVFPEAARGSGEGHYPWDLKPQSSMTNATVADLVRVSEGRRLTLKYKDGEKAVVVPDDVPVVTIRPGEIALIKPGARAFAVVVSKEGRWIATRLVVGRDGFAPPM